MVDFLCKFLTHEQNQSVWYSFLSMSQNIGETTSKNELFEHKIVISLQKIKLWTNSTIDCSLKYDYSLFCSSEVSSEIFRVTPGQTEIIPISGFKEYMIPVTKTKHELKTFMVSHPLDIRVYDGSIHLGSSTIDLGRLFTVASKCCYGTWSEKMVIPINSIEDMSKSIGTLEYLSVIEEEPCTNCKSCGVIFKDSSLLKHITHSTCKENFNGEEIHQIQKKAEMRKKFKRKYDPEKRALQHRQNYDPKKRAELHKKEYDPIKRKSRYDHLKKRMKKQEKECTIYKNADTDCAKVVRNKNSFLFKEAKKYFQACLKVCENNNGPMFPNSHKIKIKYQTLNQIQTELHKIYGKLETEIDHCLEHAQLLNIMSELEQLFEELSNTVVKEWRTLLTAIESEFRSMVSNVPGLHFEKYKFRIGLELMSDGGLGIPTNEPCMEGKRCKICEDQDFQMSKLA